MLLGRGRADPNTCLPPRQRCRPLLLVDGRGTLDTALQTSARFSSRVGWDADEHQYAQARGHRPHEECRSSHFPLPALGIRGQVHHATATR